MSPTLDELCREAKRRGKLLVYMPDNRRHPFRFMPNQPPVPKDEDRRDDH